MGSLNCLTNKNKAIFNLQMLLAHYFPISNFSRKLADFNNLLSELNDSIRDKTLF